MITSELLKHNIADLPKKSFAFSSIDDINEGDINNICLDNIKISSNRVNNFLKQIRYNEKQMNIGLTYIFDENTNIDEITKRHKELEIEYNEYSENNLKINPFMEESNKGMAKNISDTLFLLNNRLHLNLNITFESLRLIQNLSVILKKVYVKENDILPNLSDLKNILLNLNDISNLIAKFKKFEEDNLKKYQNILKYFEEILKEENIPLVKEKTASIVRIITEIENSSFANILLSREQNISLKELFKNAKISYISADNLIKNLLVIQFANYIENISESNCLELLPHNIYIANCNTNIIPKSLLNKATTLNICLIVSENDFNLDNIKYFNNLFAFVDVYSKYPEEFSKIFDENILKYSKATMNIPRYLVQSETGLKKQGILN